MRGSGPGRGESGGNREAFFLHVEYSRPSEFGGAMKTDAGRKTITRVVSLSETASSTASAVASAKRAKRWTKIEATATRPPVQTDKLPKPNDYPSPKSIAITLQHSQIAPMWDTPISPFLVPALQRWSRHQTRSQKNNRGGLKKIAKKSRGGAEVKT